MLLLWWYKFGSWFYRPLIFSAFCLVAHSEMHDDVSWTVCCCCCSEYFVSYELARIFVSDQFQKRKKTQQKSVFSLFLGRAFVILYFRGGQTFFARGPNWGVNFDQGPQFSIYLEYFVFLWSRNQFNDNINTILCQILKILMINFIKILPAKNWKKNSNNRKNKLSGSSLAMLFLRHGLIL